MHPQIRTAVFGATALAVLANTAAAQCPGDHLRADGDDCAGAFTLASRDGPGLIRKIAAMLAGDDASLFESRSKTDKELLFNDWHKCCSGTRFAITRRPSHVASRRPHSIHHRSCATSAIPSTADSMLDLGGSAAPVGSGGSGGAADSRTELAVEYTAYAAGDVVAEVELAAPETTPFVLRATLPLQPGQYLVNETTSPFVIVDSANNQVPAQVEVVSRFANPADGADVVELIARVERPEGVAAGRRLRFSVQLVEHSVGADLTPLPAVATLMNTPGAFRLRTKDVFGHSYSADLSADFGTADEVVMRNGPIARQVRTYETMLPDHPVGGSDGTLPHMMGIHAYITTWANEDFISLDLRVHNGTSGADQSTANDDPLGDLHFEQLELVMPEGWTVLTAFDNPYFGETYVTGIRHIWPIVEELADGSMHYMPSQAMFHRRMVLCAPGAIAAGRQALEERNLAFCRKGENDEGEPYLSWWNPSSARYLPQHMPLPLLDRLGEQGVRNDLAGSLASQANALRDGTSNTWPIVFPGLGWAHPREPQYGGVHGGQYIHLFDGVRTAYAASNEGYRLNQVVHRMMTDRHPTALYNLDGEPTCEEDWMRNGPNGRYMEAYMWLRPVLTLGDPFGFTSSPDGHRQAVAAQGREPDYQDALSGFQAQDTQHLVRYMRAPKTLVWLGNDALSRDDLILQGELCRMSYSSLAQNANGYQIVTGLARDQDYVADSPGDGFIVTRGEGWMIDAVATTYALTTPERRATFRPWFDQIVDLFEAGQSSCMGNYGSPPNSVVFDGNYRVRQTISESILDNALWIVRSNVYEGDNDAQSERMRQILIGNAYSLISDLVWNFTENAPWFYVAVGPFDHDQPAFCNWVPADGLIYTDDYQTWASLAYGYLLTGDEMFMRRARQMADGDIQSLQLRYGGYVENGSPMIALDQIRNE